MAWSYACPKCGAMLNPREDIVLTAAHGGRRVLVGFHPEPGNYEVYLPPGVELEPGTRWDFFCPVCHADLALPENADLCALHLVTDEGRKRVLFSRIAGRKATFVFDPDGRLESRHGPDADLYVKHIVSLKWLV